MAEAPRSSFIPKQTKSSVSSRAHKKRRFNVFKYTSFILLLTSLVFAGGTYFYRDYVASQLQAEKEALAAERNRFNESDIARVRELDRKFAAARYLLSNHLSPSKVLDTLELTTKQTVQFTNLAFSRLPSNDVSLTVRGATEEFRSVALQSLQFGKDPVFRNAIFTGLTNRQEVGIDETGQRQASSEGSNEPSVSFTVTGEVSSSLLGYEGVPSSEPAQTADTIDTDETDTSTSTDAAPNETPESGDDTSANNQ